MKSDRPAAVDPKEFFAPGRKDWTLEELRYSYGDAWQIVQGGNQLLSQLDYAAIVFTRAREDSGVLELAGTTEQGLDRRTGQPTRARFLVQWCQLDELLSGGRFTSILDERLDS